MQKASLATFRTSAKIIEDYNYALSLRQIYYQCVARQILPNKIESYQKLSRLCVQGRNEGLLPEDAFADRLRQVDRLSSWTDLQDFMKSVRHSYRKDRWQNQPNYIEIWSEKDALRSVLTQVTHYYDVSLMIVRGQVSRTAIYEAYERFEVQIDGGKDCFLYYAGDFDPSGLAIYESLKDRISNFGNAGELINFERIALTPEQIEAYHLPSDPGKESDPNYKSFVQEYGPQVVELDSLPPDVLKRLVKDCIEENILPDPWADMAEAEDIERAKLQEMVAS